MHKKFVLAALFLLIPFTLCYGQSIKLQDYKAKNSDETAIIEKLNEYLEAVKAEDKEKVLSCCHESIQLMDWHGNYLTKKEMRNTNVSDWVFSKWYGFYDPKIKLDGNEANVDLLLARSKAIIPITFQMLRKNEKWLLLKQERHP